MSASRAGRFLLAAGLFASAGACASASEDQGALSASAECFGPSCTATDAGLGQYSADVAAPESDLSRQGSLAVSVLCPSGCNPDDVLAADCFDADAGTVVDGAPMWQGGAGYPAVAVGAGAGGQSNELVPYGCYVVRSEQNQPAAVCAPSGPGTNGTPCTRSMDCAPGHGCVGAAAEASLCRRFCCTGIQACEEEKTYCAERPLREADAPANAEPLMVPVCVLGGDCVLSDPKCPEGTACTVVRADGTTACVPPGTGEAGDPCPCAEGFVCSEASQTCLKLCQTTLNGAACSQGHCQSSPALPEGFGVCTLEGG